MPNIYFSAPCVVPHVSQGRVILLSRNDTAPTSTVVQHGEALSVDCDPQYEFLASLSPVTCNNGTWSFIPRCEPARYSFNILYLFTFIYLCLGIVLFLPKYLSTQLD